MGEHGSFIADGYQVRLGIVHPLPMSVALAQTLYGVTVAVAQQMKYCSSFLLTTRLILNSIKYIIALKQLVNRCQ